MTFDLALQPFGAAEIAEPAVRRCSACREVLPLEAFNRKKSDKCFGRQSQCRQCNNAATRKWGGENVDRRRTTYARYYASNREEIRRKGEAYYRANVEQIREKSAAWYSANKERRLSRIADYRAENRARPLDMGDAHLPKRCTTVAAGGCGRIRARGDFPRSRANADQRQPHCRECKARRGAERRAINNRALLRHWADSGVFTCYLCALPFTAGEAIHVEHIMPRSLGGSDDWANLLPAHESCNLAKADAHPDEYLPDALAAYGVDYAQAVRNLARLAGKSATDNASNSA